MKQLTNDLSRTRAITGVAVVAATVAVGGWYAGRHWTQPIAPLAAQERTAAFSADASQPAAARDPGLAESYARAIELVRGKDYAAADALMRQLETQLPTLPRSAFYVGLVQDHLRRFEQSETAARTYVSQAPDDLDGPVLLATTALHARHPDRAVAALRTAIANGRADLRAFTLLAQAYAEQGDWTRASGSLERAAALAPDDTRTQHRLMLAALSTMAIPPETLDLAPGTDGLANAGDRLVDGEAAVRLAVMSGDVDGAAARLDQLRRLPGSAEVAAVLSGVVKAARLDNAGARAAFVDLLRTAPASVRARLELARLDSLEGRYAEAEAGLREVLRQDPANLPALHALIDVLLIDNRAEAALGTVQAAQAAAPSDPVLAVMLAEQTLRLGDGSKALAAFEKLPPETADLPGVAAARARAFVALNRVKDARDAYGRILAANPADAPARLALSELLASQGDITGARGVLAAGLQGAGRSRDAAMDALVRLALRTAGMDAAIAEADRLAADPANAPHGRNLRGDVLVSGQRPDSATTAYVDAMRAAPTPETAVRLASALTADGHGDKAQEYLRSWTAAHPQDADSLGALGSLALSYRRADQAAATLEAAVAIRPDDAAALNNLAWAYLTKGDPRARDTARRAYLLSPTAEIADTLGWIMTLTGEAPAAVPVLRSAVAGLQGNSTLLYHYAVALRAAGLPRDAYRAAVAALEQPGAFAERRATGQLVVELTGSPYVPVPAGPGRAPSPGKPAVRTAAKPR